MDITTTAGISAALAVISTVNIGIAAPTGTESKIAFRSDSFDVAEKLRSM